LDRKDHEQPATVLRTCVHPDGRFQVACHLPAYRVANLRASDGGDFLGSLVDGRIIDNRGNFPAGEVQVPDAAGVYEIANPFPFRGATYIGKSWADARRNDPSTIRLEAPRGISMSRWFQDHLTTASSAAPSSAALIKTLPEPMQLGLAVTSSDPEDLVVLAQTAAEFILDEETGRPVGLRYTSGTDGVVRPWIRSPLLFEAVANNFHLPDDYKDAMVLRPGAQGGSEIVGEWHAGNDSHVFEYLRRNSYIPWGHYAANMANDAVRYDPRTLTVADMTGMRHLYYQRTYVRLAEMLGLTIPNAQRTLCADELEALRNRILACLDTSARGRDLDFNGELWGWNFGFDYAPSRYRLHASHQQVHQQYALIPRHVPDVDASTGNCPPLPAYACGDMIHDFIHAYRQKTGIDFFSAYLKAIRRNRRVDGWERGPDSLIVYSDDGVMLFVPKAQTSQWELQLVTRRPVGNILEADPAMRAALDRCLLAAVQTLGNMGARMVTTIEYAKRFDAGNTGQHLLYSFLPRLPESPGAFSEAQLRWIIGHYPEDFAEVCRRHRPTFACQ